LMAEPLVTRIQYCAADEARTLMELDWILGETLLAVALKIGNARLIDNMLVKPSAEE